MTPQFKQNTFLILSAISTAEAYALSALPPGDFTTVCKCIVFVTAVTALTGASHFMEDVDAIRNIEKQIEQDLGRPGSIWADKPEVY